jgi:hypothetical protein
MFGKFWSFALAGAILAAVIAPQVTSADTPAQTVTVSGCMARAAVAAQNWMSPFGSQVSQPPIPAMLVVDFTNAASTPLSAVEFAVVSNGKAISMVRDSGTFAPNARIMHAFGISNSAVPMDTMLTCVPVRAKFADGTTWMNPSMPSH